MLVLAGTGLAGFGIARALGVTDPMLTVRTIALVQVAAVGIGLFVVVVCEALRPEESQPRQKTQQHLARVRADLERSERLVERHLQGLYDESLPPIDERDGTGQAAPPASPPTPTIPLPVRTAPVVRVRRSA